MDKTLQMVIKKEAMRRYGTENEDSISGVIERYNQINELHMNPFIGNESLIIYLVSRFEGKSEEARDSAIKNIEYALFTVKETIDLLINHDNTLKSCTSLNSGTLTLYHSIYDNGLNRLEVLMKPFMKTLPLSYISFGDDYTISDIAFITTGFSLIKRRDINLIRKFIGKK